MLPSVVQNSVKWLKKKRGKGNGNKNQQRGEKEIPTAHFSGGYRCPPLPVLDCWKIWGWAMHMAHFFERHCIFQKNVIWKVNDASSIIYSFTLFSVLFLCESHIGKQKCKHRIILNDKAGAWPSHLMPPHLKETTPFPKNFRIWRLCPSVRKLKHFPCECVFFYKAPFHVNKNQLLYDKSLLYKESKIKGNMTECS